jgi:hypothetical protein
LCRRPCCAAGLRFVSRRDAADCCCRRITKAPPAGVSPAGALHLATPGLADEQGCGSSCNQSPKEMTEIRHVYSRVTGKIIADLEQGVRCWHKPWNANHAAGRITSPLRHNGIPYKGINVVMLCSAADPLCIFRLMSLPLRASVSLSPAHLSND